SRRRHTIFSRDWSSDVCSTDLGENGPSRGGPPPVMSVGGLLCVNVRRSGGIHLWRISQGSVKKPVGGQPSGDTHARPAALETAPIGIASCRACGSMYVDTD